MVRFKLFPRQRHPRLGELLGISQASRQVSRKHHLRIAREPMSRLTNAGYSLPMQLARFLRGLFH
jgi:hypothetical protein